MNNFICEAQTEVAENICVHNVISLSLLPPCISIAKGAEIFQMQGNSTPECLRTEMPITKPKKIWKFGQFI